MSFLFIREKNLWNGFVLVAAVPPGVAVIPFTYFLNGNSFFSLVGTMGAYLGALIITPLIALWFLGTVSIDPVRLFVIMMELILLPLIVSQILVRTGASKRIEPFKGTITNWSFFVVTYTIVGLNRQVFLDHPLSLLPVAAHCPASTFLLGWAIKGIGKALSNSARDSHEPRSPGDDQKLRPGRRPLAGALQQRYRRPGHGFNHLHDRLYHLVGISDAKAKRPEEISLEDKREEG